jgi:hypothetical protein
MSEWPGNITAIPEAFTLLGINCNEGFYDLYENHFEMKRKILSRVYKVSPSYQTGSSLPQ